jgi:hypothetical protein
MMAAEQLVPAMAFEYGIRPDFERIVGLDPIHLGDAQPGAIRESRAPQNAVETHLRGSGPFDVAAFQSPSCASRERPLVTVRSFREVRQANDFGRAVGIA